MNTAVPASVDEIKNKDILLDGYIFLKYGSWGEPGYRLVYVSPDFKTISWKHVEEDKASGSIAINTFTDIKLGRVTSNFKRKPPQSAEQEKLSFSLVGSKRNLDLEASSQEQMDNFIEGMKSVILWNRAGGK